MAKINRPLSELTKQEFDDAYEEVYATRRARNQSVLSKETVIYMALQTGQITVEKALEFQTNTQQDENTSNNK